MALKEIHKVNNVHNFLEFIVTSNTIILSNRQNLKKEKYRS